MGGQPPQQGRLARTRLAAQQDPGAVGEEGVDAVGEGRARRGPVLRLGLQAEIGRVQVPLGVVPASARPGRRSSYGGTRRPAPARTPPRTAGPSGSCRGRAPPAAGRRSCGRPARRAPPREPGRGGRTRPGGSPAAAGPGGRCPGGCPRRRPGRRRARTGAAARCRGRRRAGHPDRRPAGRGPGPPWAGPSLCSGPPPSACPGRSAARAGSR